MSFALLIDFGSTYTKLVAVDLEAAQVAGQAHALTTVENDITEGLHNALARLQEQCGLKLADFSVRLACSSAKGGLRVVAIGLVPELTTEAAKRAALGAGARILRVFSHRLTLRDLQELDALAPDLILLAGGTDGGNDRVIGHNARLLASMRLSCPIVVAGNRDAADEVEAMLRSRGKDVTVTENVLPHLGELNVEPARRCIREVFMRTITRAKGLGKAEALVGNVAMPTPMAVLRAARLLAEGAEGERGWGELMVLDVGGATTDVHSVARGEPTDPMVIQRGLPEPYAKRTVEGDLGLRVSAQALLEAVGEEALREAIGVEGLDVRDAVRKRAQNVGYVPDSPEEEAVDLGMTRVAVRLGVERHVGRLREHHLPTGFCYLQEGKDLTRLPTVIGSGGPFRYLRNPLPALQEALFDPHNPFLLKPKAPTFYVDKRYLMWAMGLLAETHPLTALRILKSDLEEVKGSDETPERIPSRWDTSRPGR